MIRTLSIKNYAIIEALEMDFSRGLTIITGETGAGKSILLGALGLIMGDRADLKVFYNLEEKCIIEGVFEISKYDLKKFFAEHELDYGDEVVVRREITPSGKTRAFINDTPVTLDILRKLSGALIDLHEQFDTLDIHEVSFQLRMVDALADNDQLLKEYQQLYADYEADIRALKKLENEISRIDKEVDFLNFQLEEFNNTNLETDEQELLEDELNTLSNAEDIKRTMGQAFGVLSEGEHAIISQLEEVSRSVNSISKFSSRIANEAEKLESLILELQEVAGQFSDIADETEYDGERILEVQTRLDLIYKLQKKHQVNSVEELLRIQENFQRQLDKLKHQSSSVPELEKKISRQKQQLDERAAKLSSRRKAVVPDFEKKIAHLLAQLAMPSAQLKIEIEPAEQLGNTGLDDVNFKFAANRGSRLQMIKDVASGGELARLTLITKSLVASAIPLPTLIFDEIDAGVSGDVALKMGKILRALSNRHQVVVITHSPQVAAYADSHYFIYKKETDTRTVTYMKPLNAEERIRALAVMLSQNPPTAAALQNARELLNFQKSN